MRHPRLALTLALGAALGAPGTAAAEAPSVEVTITPKGRPWSIGAHGAGIECSPSCVLHLRPETYRVSIGGAKEPVLLDAPAEIVYLPGSRLLRYIGGGAALGGAGIGALMVYVAAKACVTDAGTNNPPCNFPTMSRASQQALITLTAVVFSTAVAGGILFLLSDEGIRVSERPKPRAVEIGLRPLLGAPERGSVWQGGMLGIRGAF